jgi:hypothetical protein
VWIAGPPIFNRDIIRIILYGLIIYILPGN